MVSVIMPAFNASAFIAESIDSVSAQTYTNWELIVVDDGSTDATPDIVHSKAAQDRRITYLRQENGRQAKARNLGLRHARGDLLAFLDADDLWLKDKLEIMVQEFSSGNQDLLFSDSYEFQGNFDLDREEWAGVKTMGVVAREYSGFDGLSDFLDVNKIPMLTVICKPDVVKNLRFNEVMSPAEDYDLWLRMLIVGCKFRALSTPLAAYRLHTGSATSGDRLATDVVIAIIYSLSQSVHDERLKLLMDSKMRGWLRRKLRTVSDYVELKRFVDVLSAMNSVSGLWLVVYLNAISNIVFRISRKILSKLL